MSDQADRPIRILIVDDHPVVVAGLTSMLGTQPGLVVLGSATSGEEAIEFLRTKHVDLILLDLRMPGMTGVDTLVALRRESMNARVIILSTHETDEEIYQAVRAGAQAYLSKNSKQAEMIEAIQAVYRGKRYFPHHIADRLTERMMRTDLTGRESEVLHMLARGLTNKEIGSALDISSNTARNHVKSIIEKLEVSDRTEAVAVAIQRGLIELHH